MKVASVLEGLSIGLKDVEPNPAERVLKGDRVALNLLCLQIPLKIIISIYCT